jgi:DNA (cytosine-5)-methyltransferase 1
MVGRVEETFWRRGRTLFRRTTAGHLAAVTSLGIPDRRVKPTTPEKVKYWWDYFELRGTGPEESRTSHGEIRIADLFCGCGGLSLGFARAARAVGLFPSIVLAADTDRGALQVYQRSLNPLRVLHENLWSLVEFQLLRGANEHAAFLRDPLLLHPALRSLIGGVDVVIGGPPCQGHSNFNNATRRNDPRNLLYLVPLVVGIATGARAVVIENVPEVTRDKFAQVTTLAEQLAENNGYRVDHLVVNALNLGVPQSRRRHILVASRDSKPDLLSCFEVLRTPARDIKFAIKDLAKLEGRTMFDEPAILSIDNRKRIEYLFENGLFDLPDDVRPDCHKNGTTYRAVYGRLRWDRPSGTITTGFLTPGRGRYIHPERRRGLTPHEGARLQGFGDDFAFWTADGSPQPKKYVSKWIGDAVPPPMGYLAALCVLSCMR